jgi:cation:H+ antiporter
MVPGPVVDGVLVVVGGLGLWVGANLLVTSSTRIARKLGVSDLVIGLTVVALGTSAPEMLVTVGAALEGQPDIAIGNVVGSNLFNLGVILGGVAVVGGSVPATRSLVRRDGTVLVGVVFLVLVLFRDHRLSRLEGLALVAVLVAYLAYLFRVGQPLERTVGEASAFSVTDLGRLVLGLAALGVGARALVTGAADLAALSGLSEWTIGVTVVAAGTSAPELATSVAAARRAQTNLAAGNLVGSDLFNMLGVLGVAGAIHPVSVSPAVVPALLSVLVLVVAAVVFLWTAYRITRIEGVVLIAIALLRWGMDVLGGP